MLRHLASACAALALATPLAAQRAAIDSAVRRAAATLLEDRRFVGVAVGVLRGDETWTYGFGEVARGAGRQPDARTVYAIGSITKTFAAALLARGEVEGRFRVDDDVRPHLAASFPNLAFGNEPVRLSHLVMHRSGLPRTFAAESIGDAAARRAAFFRELRAVRLDTTPGSRFAYSNAGAQLLGYVLEDRFGAPFDSLVTRYVARPLGMVDTRVALDAERRARFATGYDAAGAPVAPERIDAAGAAGALKSTVADMLRYARWHVASGDPVVALAMRPRIEYPGGYRAGLNWQIMLAPDGAPTVWQDGGVPGHSSLVVMLPSQRAALVILATVADYAPGLNAMASRIIPSLAPGAAQLP